MNEDLEKHNFYGRDFFVNEDVLTPRPETEQLIDEVLKLCGKAILPGVKPQKPLINPNTITILDIGTGSGCIAITLKKELEEADIHASDVSKEALEIARKNAKDHHAEINLIESNLLENINFAPDIIVANLPYVNENWDWLDKKSLKTDPDLALYAKDGGLELIKKLVDAANSKYLVLEADPSQHQEIIDYAKNYKLLEKNGFILVFSKY